MANSIHGVVDIEIDGKTMQMRFTMGAAREIKEKYKKPLEKLMTDGGFEMGMVADIIHAGLKRGSHPDIALEELEDLLLFNEMETYVLALGRAFGSANTGKTEVPKAKGNSKAVASLAM